jgi:glycosyltransferase involved in cell wall biosynthesis
VSDPQLLRKVEVVYPAIRKVEDEFIRFHDGSQGVSLLFSGDFFRKGGVNVIDAFERAQKLYPNLKLRLCCGESMDFNTPNLALREEYLRKIKANPGVMFGRATREELVRQILPHTDVYLLPTYTETFGFAILEAMAFGIPTISTNFFAIPEMLEHNVSGLLIDTSRYDCERLFRGYTVKEIPPDFREHVTEQLFRFMCSLIESVELRKRIGLAALETARTKFSFEVRNRIMLKIYREALA